MAGERRMTCINCPMGCELAVRVENGEVAEVKGNQCPRGAAYAKAESAHPVRMVTSTVRLRGADVAQLPVKSAAPVPKDKVRDCVRALKPVAVDAPVAAGAVILADAAGTGVDIVATRGVARAAPDA